MTGKKKASCSSWCSQSSVSNRNQPNVIITSLWGGFLKGNKLPASVTIWKRNPSRYQGSWQTTPPPPALGHLWRVPSVIVSMHTQLGRKPPNSDFQPIWTFPYFSFLIKGDLIPLEIVQRQWGATEKAHFHQAVIMGTLPTGKIMGKERKFWLSNQEAWSICGLRPRDGREIKWQNKSKMSSPTNVFERAECCLPAPPKVFSM